MSGEIDVSYVFWSSTLVKGNEAMNIPVTNSQHIQNAFKSEFPDWALFDP